MKKSAVVICFMLATQVSFSQDDAKAQEILKSVSTKYKTLKSIGAKFNLDVNDQQNKNTEKQTGTILIKGAKYKLILGAQEIYCDGKVVWTYLKDANEVQVNNPKTDENAITPNTIFTMYEKGFKSKYTGEKTLNGKVMQLVELVPEDAKKSYFKVQLTINKTEKYIAQAKIFNRNGTNFMYSISTFTPNAPAADEAFVFNEKNYPKVEVIDLRD